MKVKVESPKIRKIITRFPNLETGFFGALTGIEKFRRHLGITAGQLKWEFISTASQIGKDEPGVVYFNVGGNNANSWDQHGHPANQSLCELCSLDVVRGNYDFLWYRPWLRKIYAVIRQNDIDGRRISRHKYNLRELASGLNAIYADEPQIVFNWLVLAFSGIFANCKYGGVAKIFDPDQLVRGVERYDVRRMEWFQKLLHQAIKKIDRQWESAQKAIATAEEDRWNSTVERKYLGSIRIVLVKTKSAKVAAASRKAGYHVCIQWPGDGHCQIHGGTILANGAKCQIDMSLVAAELRRAEAKLSRQRIDQRERLSQAGYVHIFPSGKAIPWYLPEYRTAVYNGTLSSPNVPATILKPGEVMDLTEEAIVKSNGFIWREGVKKHLLLPV